MVSRRTFLAAGATGTLAAVAGCADAVPLVGSSSRDHSDAIQAGESFLAEPSFAPALDVVGEPHGASCTIKCYDTSITEYADELGVEDLTYFGWGPLHLREESGAAIESVDYTIVADFATNWQHDDPEGELPRYGEVSGGVVSMRGEYERDAYEDAKGLTDAPTISTNGYDAYDVAPYQRAVGVADDGIVEGLLRTVHVPGEDVDERTEQAAAEALFERATERSTSMASPPGTVRDVVDAVAPAHYLEAGVAVDSEDGDVAADAKGLHVDGPETTVVLAKAGSTASAFDSEEWTDGTIERRIVSSMRSIARDVVRDAGTGDEAIQAIRDTLLEGPTIDVDDNQGVARAVLPSEAVTNPRF